MCRHRLEQATVINARCTDRENSSEGGKLEKGSRLCARGRCSELIFVTVHPESLNEADRIARTIAVGREIVTSKFVYVRASASSRLFPSTTLCYLSLSLPPSVSAFLCLAFGFPADLECVNLATAERVQSDTARLRPIWE